VKTPDKQQRSKCNTAQGNAVPPPPVLGSKRNATSEVAWGKGEMGRGSVEVEGVRWIKTIWIAVKRDEERIWELAPPRSRAGSASVG